MISHATSAMSATPSMDPTTAPAIQALLSDAFSVCDCVLEIGVADWVVVLLVEENDTTDKAGNVVVVEALPEMICVATEKVNIVPQAISIH